MSDAADSPADGASHVACVSCGYDLRGLDADGPCPECGTPIARSLRGDLLAFADPAWLTRIVRGQRWLARGMLIIILAIVGFMAAFLFVITAALIPWGEMVAVAFDWTVSLILPLGLQVGAIAFTIGAFLVTARDPRETLREKPLSARNVARRAMLACIVLISLRIGTAMTPLGAGLMITAAFLVLISVAVIAAVLSLLTFLRGLVRRTGDDALNVQMDKRLARLRWFLPVFCGVVIANRLLGAAVMAPGGGRGVSFSVMLSIVAFILGIAMLMELDSFTRLMFACRRAFEKCAAEAEPHRRV
jgi:hypothetical protein